MSGPTICLTGDVMTGRGIDQILPHPSDPLLYESYVKDARDYVRLAESAGARIEAPVDWEYIWGEALPWLKSADARIVNLETSITRSDAAWPDKRIHYRMHPDNVPCLQAADIDCCVLANNHVLDWGRKGLQETLATLKQAGISTAGAGLDRAAAQAPAVLPLPDGRRLLVFAFGATSSGIPEDWRAGITKSGISLLDDYSAEAVGRISAKIAANRRAGDVVIVSLHWGSNWGYAVSDTRVRFARALVESAGVDLVHGHSSHHPIGIERYHGRLILYGCGDFLNDYEGISGQESFRPDLTLLYRLTLAETPDEPIQLRMVPFQIRAMRLVRASRSDAEWLATALDRASAPFETRIKVSGDNILSI